MRVSLCTSLPTLLLACASASGAHPRATPPTYTVRFDAAHPRLVHIDALLPSEGDSLWMSQNDEPQLSNGWATYVNTLQLRDMAGKPIAIEPLGAGRWRMEPHGGGPLHLSYDVNVQHDTVHWTVSAAFARAYAVDSALFFTGRTMFIVSAGSEHSPIAVHFALPDQWTVATAYEEDASAPNHYRANGRNDLWANGTMAGHLATRELHVGDLRVVLGGPATTRAGLDLLATSLGRIVTLYDSIMGGAPRGKLAVIESVAPLADGGEAMPRTVSLMLRAEPSLATKGRWAYLLSHELFHLWNGRTLTARDRSQLEWFTEGFTDYMAKLAALRTALITEQEFRDQLARSYDRYVAGRGRVSMRDGGREKSKNFALLYYGGMTVALALDLQARERDLTQGFPTFMHRMYAEFGVTTRAYEFDDVVRVASAVNGSSVAPFFATHVSGTALIPLDTLLARAGMSLHHSGTTGPSAITPSVDATPAQRALWNALLTR